MITRRLLKILIFSLPPKKTDNIMKNYLNIGKIQDDTRQLIYIKFASLFEKY